MTEDLAASASASAAPQPLRVVLVDETPAARLVLRAALESERGFAVVGVAGDGDAGVAEVRRQQPDVIVLDPTIAGTDASGLLAQVRLAAPRASVVALAAPEWQPALQAPDPTLRVRRGLPATRIVAEISAAIGTGAFGRPVVSVAGGETVDAGDGRADLERVQAAVASAAHELRGPSTVLLAMSELLATDRDSLDRNTFDRMLDAINRQARVLDRVTGDLLASSQSQRQALMVEVRTTPLLPLLDSAVVAVAAQDVSLDCPPELVVAADPTRLAQVVGNLLSNAFKHGTAPVSITAHAAGGDVLVQVTDSGPGVPELFRPMLFEQFRRAEGVRSSGMGVGLYVVRSLVEAQGGRAWYEPAETGGSFCFTLPVVDPSDPDRPYATEIAGVPVRDCA